jgi:hypothetical protein
MGMNGNEGEIPNPLARVTKIDSTFSPVLALVCINLALCKFANFC